MHTQGKKEGMLGLTFTETSHSLSGTGDGGRGVGSGIGYLCIARKDRIAKATAVRYLMPTPSAPTGGKKRKDAHTLTT